MAGIQHTHTDKIEDPSAIPFDAQLCLTKRMLAYYHLVESKYPAEVPPLIAQYKKKIKVLENLISLYGGNPAPYLGMRHFIGIVYGEDFYDEYERQLPSEYEKGLYICDGTSVAVAAEFNPYIKHYVADGNGKYRFVRKTKK